MQREQATLSGDKELKANTLRSTGDQISRKTVELGNLRAQADKRKRDEAALRELEEYLVQLQADLKVGPSLVLALVSSISDTSMTDTNRRWTLLLSLPRLLGGRRTRSSLDIAPKGRLPRMKLHSTWVYTSPA